MSEKLYNFYGMSTPTLLLAPIEVVQEMLSKLTNSFSSHMLNSLCIEAKLLRYSLYERGIFRYYVDENTERVQSIIRYADFGMAYRKYLSEMNSRSESGRPGKSDDVDELGNVSSSHVDSDSTNLFGFGEIPESGSGLGMNFDDIPEDSFTDMPGLSDMPATGGLSDLPDISAIGNTVNPDSDSSVTEDKPGFNFDDILEDDFGDSNKSMDSLNDLPDLDEIPADDFSGFKDIPEDDFSGFKDIPEDDFSGFKDIPEDDFGGGLDDEDDFEALNDTFKEFEDSLSDKRDFLSDLGISFDSDSSTQSDSKTKKVTNKSLLEELAYDAKFYASFESGNFEEVSPRISEWKCEVIFTLKDLRKYINLAHRVSSDNLPELEANLAALDKTYENIKNSISQANYDPTFAETRLKINAESRDRILSQIEAIKISTELFGPEFADGIDALLESCPRVLAHEYTLGDSSGTLTDLEYAIISRYHKCCIEDVKGVRKIDYLIDLLTTTRDRNTVNTQKFFNVAFNVLATKNSYSSLLVFNKQFKEFLKTYKDITDKLYVKSIHDCKTLLATAQEREATLKNIFTIQQSRYGDSEKDIFPVTIMDVETRVAVLQREGKLQKFGFEGIPVTPEEVTEFIRILIKHECLLDLIDSDESIYTLFKIWSMLRRYSATQMLNYAGVQDLIKPDENGVVLVSASWLKEFFLKFGIPGLYADPEGKFLRCLRNGVSLVDENSTSIDRHSKELLYDNIVIIQRYLESVMVSVNNELPILRFWR